MMNELMKSDDADIKPKSRLAVFEHVTHNKVNSPGKFSFSNRSNSPSSVCNDLVIDDQDYDLVAPKKKNRGVALQIEPLTLTCGWNNCYEVFINYKQFLEHIHEHVLSIEEDLDPINCLWNDCVFVAPSLLSLVKHACFHGYHSKLKNIGENVLSRNELPPCNFSNIFQIPEQNVDYNCDWEDCNVNFLTIYEFFEHIRYHVNSNPKYCKKGDFIKCEWSGCNFKCTSQYKLSDHLRSHTKEKTIACPTCGNVFATKTKFADHRNRQLPIDLQSYQCSQCSKLFPSERLLRDHMRSHVNHYKCSMCDMTCPKPSILAKHIRYRHLSERPFKCNLCEHACVSKENLEGHLISHCAEKLMACEDCDFRCRSLYGLDRHYQKVHGGGWTQTYECHICQKNFQRGNYLTQHLIKAHDFNWPSGHSRFRYKENTDGIYRLQTVRYESLEVTQEMMRTNNINEKDQPKCVIKYDLKKEEASDKQPSYILMISESGEENVVCPTDNNILITIDDVDERGNIIKSETVESNEIVCAPESVRKLRPRKTTSKT